MPHRFVRLAAPACAQALFVLAAAPAHAAIGVGSSAFTYSQSFDSLAATTSATAVAWANDATIAGWSLFVSNGTAAPSYLADAGGSNAGSFRSFGVGGSTDRALGSVASGGAYFGSPASNALAGWIAVAFTNTSGSTLGGFTLGYSGEQWRNGGNTAAQSLVLQYGFGSSFGSVTDWVTPGGNFDAVSPIVGSSAAAVDGNAAGRVAGLGGSIRTPWNAGDTLWLRFADLNDNGNDHGLGIDDFSLSVSAVPEPGTLVMLLAGVSAIGFVARRRA